MIPLAMCMVGCCLTARLVRLSINQNSTAPVVEAVLLLVLRAVCALLFEVLRVYGLESYAA